MSDTKEKEMPMMEEEKLNDQMQVRREKMQNSSMPASIPSARNIIGITMPRK